SRGPGPRHGSRASAPGVRGDRPHRLVDDLPRGAALERARPGPLLMSPRISIVLPVRNDADALGRTLDWLVRLPGMDRAEVIVAAAPEPDATEAVVGGRARVIRPGGATRAELMNAGAAVARGEVLLFLHADSFPPPRALSLIE